MNSLIKKSLIMMMICFFFMMAIPVKAIDYVPINLSTGNGTVKYRGTNIDVTIPTQYTEKDTEFRAVWVSALTGDITTYTSQSQYKKEIEKVFEVMEHYNLNTMLFHVRIKNDAFYESAYNDWSIYYNTDPDWEALPWIIEECHKRGIEFHAWMNPYRVSSSPVVSLTELAKTFPAANAASNPANLLNGSGGVILNPGIPSVRSFLIRTCMELVENYDVDAIHFDDYFYTSGIDDSTTYRQYGNGMGLEDWRREQINLFIKGLSDSIKSYNLANDRRVQLGISPAGIWKSGNGVVTYDGDGTAVTTGSNTGAGAYQCYGNYLYADTKKWVDNEWLDYLLPQTYWALEHSMCAYADLVEWWDKVAKYKKTNLYASLALYQLTNNSSGNSWYTNPLEGYNEIMFVNSKENIRGLSVYDFKTLKSAMNSPTTFKNVENLWSKPKIIPELRRYEPLPVGTVNNLSVAKTDAGYKISFDKLDDAKFYVIYRSSTTINYHSEEVVKVIGNNGDVVEYIDEVDVSRNYNYAVRAQSASLTLGEGVEISTVGAPNSDIIKLGDFEKVIVSDNIIPGTDTKFQFSFLSYPFGGAISYTLDYSFDNENWDTITKFNDYKGMNSANIYIPSDATVLYYRIKAQNRVSYTETEVEKIDFSNRLKPITNFGYTGSVNTGKMLEFVWNNYSSETLQYQLQMSLDSYVFTTIATVATNGLVNTRHQIAAPEVGTYYYRVASSVDGKNVYSDVVRIDTRGSLNDFLNFTVNDAEIKDSYLVNWDEIISIKWKVASSANSYIARYSLDGVNWQVLRLYNPNCSFKKENGFAEQTIELLDTIYKVYIQIEASSATGSEYSDVVVLYVRPGYYDYEMIGNYLIDERKSAIANCNIFK